MILIKLIFTNPNYISNIKYFIKIVIIESNSNYFNIDIYIIKH